MECLKRKQAEGSNTTNWDEAVRLYADVIASENDSFKIQATMKLAKMSKYAPEHILALTVPIRSSSACSLKCIASQGEGKLAILIGQSGAIPILLSLFSDSSEGLQSILLKCLRNIVTFGVSNRTIVDKNGGLEIVLAMLNSCLDDSKLILLEILSALALIREVRKHLWSSKSVHFLVEAASFGSLISRTRAAQAIGLIGMVKKPEKVAGAVAQLSYSEVHREVLASCGAIPLLINMLENELDELRDNVAEALLNFSLDPLLGDQISCVLENHSFRYMRNRRNADARLR
ncbi:hypothetical protein ACJIZ3_007010 [Penstemon smallii]|uniref:Uncharacterized protein n=1 Tax=Penstemon smallii TaxID=265156 RepID=A0ABD3S9B7_9LAMI